MHVLYALPNISVSATFYSSMSPVSVMQCVLQFASRAQNYGRNVFHGEIMYFTKVQDND